MYFNWIKPLFVVFFSKIKWSMLLKDSPISFVISKTETLQVLSNKPVSQGPIYC